MEVQRGAGFPCITPPRLHTGGRSCDPAPPAQPPCAPPPSSLAPWSLGCPLRDVQEAASHADPRTRCAATWRAARWTGTPPTSSPPASPERHGKQQDVRIRLAAPGQADQRHQTRPPRCLRTAVLHAETASQLWADRRADQADLPAHSTGRESMSTPMSSPSFFRRGLVPGRRVSGHPRRSCEPPGVAASTVLLALVHCL
jgi:hypothetical protein